jgi:hypothetical protein
MGVISIYTPIMDIVKAFNTNDLHTEIIIKGTVTDPLFRASDVGVVLELSNIRATIIDFDESEKVVSLVDTLGGAQEVSKIKLITATLTNNFVNVGGDEHPPTTPSVKGGVIGERSSPTNKRES